MNDFKVGERVVITEAGHSNQGCIGVVLGCFDHPSGHPYLKLKMNDSNNEIETWCANVTCIDRPGSAAQILSMIDMFESDRRFLVRKIRDLEGEIGRSEDMEQMFRIVLSQSKK